MQLGPPPNTTDSSDACVKVTPYSGQICTEVFTSLQICYSGVSSQPPALNIPSSIDQQQGESYADQLLKGVLLLNPAPECLESMRPFLCLHIFGLCDTSDNFHTTLRGGCLSVRDDVCSSEWRTAMSFLPPDALPVCEDLPDEVDECTGLTAILTFTSTGTWFFGS